MFFIDVQGTLIDDEKRLPINGALDFISRLNREKIPYMIILGEKEQGSNKLSVRTRGGEQIQELSIEKFLTMIHDG